MYEEGDEVIVQIMVAEIKPNGYYNEERKEYITTINEVITSEVNDRPIYRTDRGLMDADNIVGKTSPYHQAKQELEI